MIIWWWYFPKHIRGSSSSRIVFFWISRYTQFKAHWKFKFQLDKLKWYAQQSGVFLLLEKNRMSTCPPKIPLMLASPIFPCRNPTNNQGWGSARTREVAWFLTEFSSGGTVAPSKFDGCSSIFLGVRFTGGYHSNRLGGLPTVPRSWALGPWLQWKWWNSYWRGRECTCIVQKWLPANISLLGSQVI